MTDREKAGLRGPVALCETEVLFSPRGLEKSTHVTLESYRLDGRRIEMSDTRRSEWTNRWHYYDYDDGRPREVVFEGADAFRRVFVYDDKARLKAVSIHNAEGRHLEESYTYHDDGTVVHTSYPRKPPGLVGVLADSMLHLSGDAVRITTLLDSRGNALEKVLYDVDRRPIQRVLFLYDTAGRVVEEGEAYTDNRMRDDFRNLYRYDEQGRHTEIERYFPFGGTRQTMTYNEQGDLVERHTVSLPTDIDFMAQSPWAEYFGYEYDTRSNWIRRTLEHHLEETGETIHRDEHRRRLEYWNSVQET